MSAAVCWPLAETLLVHAEGLLAVVEPKIDEKTESVVVVVPAEAGGAAEAGMLAAVEAVPVAAPEGAFDLRPALGLAAEVGVWAAACTLFGGMLTSGFCAWFVAKELYGKHEGAITWTAISAMCGAAFGMVVGLMVSGVIVTCFRPAAAFFFSCCCFRRERAFGGGSSVALVAEDDLAADPDAGRTGRTAALAAGAAWVGTAVAAAVRLGAALWPLGGTAAAAGGDAATPVEAVVVAVLPEAREVELENRDGS